MSILSILIIIIALLFIFFIISLSLGLKIFLRLRKNDDVFKTDLTVKLIAITVFSKKFTYNTKENKISEEKSFEKESKKSLKTEKIKKSAEKKEKNLKEYWEIFKRLYPLIKLNIAPIFDFLIRSIHSVKLQKFNTYIILGLPSFTDTATFTGYIWAFSAVPNLSKHFNLFVEPNFTKEVIDFDSEIIFKIELLKPFLALLKLLLRKSMFKLIWNLRVLIK